MLLSSSPGPGGLTRARFSCSIFSGDLTLAPVRFDIFSFEPLGAKPDPVKDVLSLFQRLELDAVQLGVMEEYILTAVVADKSKASIFD